MVLERCKADNDTESAEKKPFCHEAMSAAL
jgi:hypothetical protein